MIKQDLELLERSHTLWTEMQPKERDLWVSLWNTVFHQRQQLSTSQLTKLEKTIRKIQQRCAE